MPVTNHVPEVNDIGEDASNNKWGEGNRGG